MQDNAQENVQENVQSDEEDSRQERIEYFLYYSPDCTFHEERQCAYLSNVDSNLLDGGQGARSAELPPPVALQETMEHVQRPKDHVTKENATKHVPDCSNNIVSEDRTTSGFVQHSRHIDVLQESVTGSNEMHVLHAFHTGTGTQEMDHNVQRNNMQRQNVRGENMQSQNMQRHREDCAETSETMRKFMLQHSPAGQNCTERTANSVFQISGQNLQVLQVKENTQMCQLCDISDMTESNVQRKCIFARTSNDSAKRRTFYQQRQRTVRSHNH